MSEILNELQEVKKASQEQTAASQAQTAEVAGKMADIDQKVAEAEQQFNDFISGDFNDNVINALTVKVFIDPVDGDDNNDGSTSGKSIKTSARLFELTKHGFNYLKIHLRHGTEFELNHSIVAKVTIEIGHWSANDGAIDRAIVKQGSPYYCSFSAPDIYINNVQLLTYQASENETLPESYKTALFGSKSKIRLIAADLCIYDNQLIHIHDGGSGDSFHRRSISLYQSNIKVFASEAGVVNSRKNIFTRYSAAIAPPVDIFAVSLGLELNGQQATLRSLLGIPDTNVITNLNLDMA
ncbi:hypothetical protein L2D37_25685 [Vibrio harveyi]|uniref:hypothetical protein n=1 Tax=Vibrio harveyi TaxID=669 RepID=UPI003BB596D7